MGGLAAMHCGHGCIFQMYANQRIFVQTRAALTTELFVRNSGTLPEPVALCELIRQNHSRPRRNCCGLHYYCCCTAERAGGNSNHSSSKLPQACALASLAFAAGGCCCCCCCLCSSQVWLVATASSQQGFRGC